MQLPIHKSLAPVNIVASIAALHGCGKVFIQRSKSVRVAGSDPSA
jgi:hypothetical protein